MYNTLICWWIWLYGSYWWMLKEYLWSPKPWLEITVIDVIKIFVLIIKPNQNFNLGLIHKCFLGKFESEFQEHSICLKAIRLSDLSNIHRQDPKFSIFVILRLSDTTLVTDFTNHYNLRKGWQYGKPSFTMNKSLSS